LNFDIVAEEILEDRTNRIILRVAPEDLVYLGYILESFEGWCNYTTIQNNEPLLQIDMTHDYVDCTKELIQFLKSWEI